jgi:hypothetical protein
MLQKSTAAPIEPQHFVSQAETFTYTFIPIEDMEDVWLTRQNEHPLTPQSLENHVYPFHTLPKVTSHLHPKFAIFMLGYWLNAASGKARVAVDRQWPTTDKVISIWAKWLKEVPDHALSDPAYIDPNVKDKEDEEEEEGMSILDAWESDGDSDRTRPRRIPYPPPKPVHRPPPPQSPAVHASQPSESASSTAVVQDDSCWSHDQIFDWARSCSTTPPPDIDIKSE